jgi:hypothetical protein
MAGNRRFHAPALCLPAESARTTVPLVAGLWQPKYLFIAVVIVVLDWAGVAREIRTVNLGGLD